VRFLLLIVAVLVIEMYLLIKIGGELGAIPTIVLVFVTAALGLWMLRLQGLATLRRASSALVSGEAPVREAAEGIILLIGGILLLIPGFFTDFVGFLCLLPPTRALLLKQFDRNVRVVKTRHYRGKDSSYTIDGEWLKESEPKSKSDVTDAKKRLSTPEK
jgi:UPF0716 protein FxsA